MRSAKEQLEERRASLSSEKRAILEKTLEGDAVMAGVESHPSASVLPTIVPDPARRYEVFPLTDVQQAYWIGRGSSIELGNIATHAYVEVEVKNFDLEKYEFAWQKVISRHDMLRAIVLPNGTQQILEDVPPFRLEILDLRGQPAEVAEARLLAVRERMSHLILPADQWPLFEIRVSRLTDEWVRIHCSFDFLTLDSWSIQSLSREVAEIYVAPDEPLPALELFFRDYVLAERALQETELYRRAVTYWQERLPTLAEAPELPLAQIPGSLTHPRFARRESELNAPLWQQVRQWANQRGLTPSAALLG